MYLAASKMMEAGCLEEEGVGPTTKMGVVHLKMKQEHIDFNHCKCTQNMANNLS